MMRERAAGAKVAHLATLRPDGTPHVVPCCFVLDRDTIYSAIDTKSKSTLKLQRLENLRRHPAVAVLIDHYDDDWAELWWVRAAAALSTTERNTSEPSRCSRASTPSTGTSPSRAP